MDSAIATLRSRLSGEAVTPDAEGYEQLRNSRMALGAPAVVIRCRAASDVSAGIEHAVQQGLPLAVRSGGHSMAGFSTNDGGVVLDLSGLDRVEMIDAERRLVRLGAGAQWGPVAAALAEHGLVISSGDTTSVGVGGLILGGGIGWLVRQHGLTIDSVVAAEVVTADGRVRRVSAAEEPDLFWGVRGGGGTLGVVTSFDVVAQPGSAVYAGRITYPVDEAEKVIAGWAGFARSAPREVTTSLFMVPAFFGNPAMLMVAVCYCGPTADAEGVLQPLRDLGTVLDDDLAERPYAALLEEPPPVPPGAGPAVDSGFLRELDAGVIERAIAAHREFGLAVQLRALGGAVADVPAEATAFAHRDSAALLVTGLFDKSPEKLRGFADFWSGLRSATTGAYGNFLSQASGESAASVYPPATRQRLAELKRRYDPANLFAGNHAADLS